MKDILVEYYNIIDFVTGSPGETLREAFHADLACPVIAQVKI